MKRQLRSKYGFLIVIGMVLLLFAYTSTFANNQGIVLKNPISDELERKVTPDAVLVGEKVKLEYRFALNNVLDFEKGPNINSYKYVEWAVTINETIPEGFEVNKAEVEKKGLVYSSATRSLTGTVEIMCGKKNLGLESCNEYKNEAFYDSLTLELTATKPGTFQFTNGRFSYSLEADHAGNGNGSVKHDRSISDPGSKLPSSTVTVEALNIKLPSELNLYLNETGNVNAEIATVKAKMPSTVTLKWSIVNPEVVKQTNAAKQSLSVEALKVGTTTIQAVYVHSNGYESKSQPVTVKVRLPDLAIDSTEKVLWVYQNKSGSLVKQQAVLNLTQLIGDNQVVNNPFDATWAVNSTALSIVSSQNSTATVQAEHGSTGNVSVIAALTKYPGQTETSLIEVKEYPQRVATPNVVLYMSDSPYEYPVKFWPETANVTGYGLTVLEGKDVLKAENGVLTLAKPGIAKVGLVTQDVSASFEAGEGPEVISQTFYVQVKEGADPNPGTAEPSTDFY